MNEQQMNGRVLKTGWGSRLAAITLAVFLIETITGLAVTFAPFHPSVQWGVIVHTLLGLLALIPLAWYLIIHWADYKRYALSHLVLVGYVGAVALIVCLVSGVVVTWQGMFGIHTTWAWRQTHLISTLAALVTLVWHLVASLARTRIQGTARPARACLWQTAAGTILGTILTAALALLYPGNVYENEFPEDYSFLYGKDRPFAPSLARTSTGGAFDARSLSGSASCGTSGCHEQILREWQPSSHRYAAMDKLFQGIQGVMAKQNGPESTRYCGGCHDPISLFSGAKNVFSEDLTNLEGYNEGVSCLSCHSIQETDLKGNANYVLYQPREYLWQWSDEGITRYARDFLIRTYPAEHNKLSKRVYKAPEYCAACHKQFIDKEVNQVGWVQLQNQYDNWKASHWYHEGDPSKTIECRECHMPLVTSTDPASGDTADYNRSPEDGKHRSHRFIASNQLMPKMLELEGWEEQVSLTEEWLQGKTKIPEIQSKWAEGPIVRVALEVPESIASGETIPVRVILTSNKVGHDFPTGPLDIIQSWVELQVSDESGNIIFTSGTRDENNFIEPGSFLFKAEPVDQYGNLIDRHNLWEMVGVRYRRALFPGFSDTVDYVVSCPSTLPVAARPEATSGGEDEQRFEIQPPAGAGSYQVTARLHYRKVDQFLLNFLFGEDSGITAPVVEIDSATARVEVRSPGVAGGSAGR